LPFQSFTVRRSKGERRIVISSLLDVLLSRGAIRRPAGHTFVSGGDETESLTFGGLTERARAIGASATARCPRREGSAPVPRERNTSRRSTAASGRHRGRPSYPPRSNRNLKRFESIIADATPKVALTTEGVYRQLSERFGDHPGLRALHWIVTSEVCNDEASQWVTPNVHKETLAFLQYTSASTSAPKGVMVTHGNILHNEELMRAGVRHRDSTSSCRLPLFTTWV
jgi:hypothetical protein